MRYEHIFIHKYQKFKDLLKLWNNLVTVLKQLISNKVWITKKVFIIWNVTAVRSWQYYRQQFQRINILLIPLNISEMSYQQLLRQQFQILVWFFIHGRRSAIILWYSRSYQILCYQKFLISFIQEIILKSITTNIHITG